MALYNFNIILYYLYNSNKIKKNNFINLVYYVKLFIKFDYYLVFSNIAKLIDAYNFINLVLLDYQ